MTSPGLWFSSNINIKTVDGNPDGCWWKPPTTIISSGYIPAGRFHPKNRWGRCPGFRNRKNKHRNSTGGYPLAKLIWIDWRSLVDIPKISTPQGPLQKFPHQPTQGGVCQHRQISRSNYQRADESATDFAYAIALFRRGYTAQFVRHGILSERKNWENHSGEKRKQHYLERTIKRAKSIALWSWTKFSHTIIYKFSISLGSHISLQYHAS